MLARGAPANLVELLVHTNDAANLGDLVEVEPPAGAIIRGPTALIEALRPLMSSAGA